MHRTNSKLHLKCMALQSCPSDVPLRTIPTSLFTLGMVSESAHCDRDITTLCYNFKMLLQLERLHLRLIKLLKIDQP